jgi:transcription elongation GreA/GreB family factor
MTVRDGPESAPERWADDMRRQRVLERVGWRFWRCWSSSFTLDPDGCMADLLATLDRLSIGPLSEGGSSERYTEQRVVPSPDREPRSDDESGPIVSQAGPSSDRTQRRGPVPAGVRLGDRVVIRYLDDNKTATYTLSEERDDPINGFVPIHSPLGRQLLGLTEEDEVEFEANGQVRRVLVMRAARETTSPV